MSISAGFPTGEELPERIGHYTIRRRIGQGGMGVVYQAEDPRTNQFVAVKVLKPEVAGDEIARARLAREVETMRRVQSPNVAEVIEADTQAELPWVITEYIPGPTLDSTVTDHGPLRGRALTRFVTGMARAIKDIHAVDVIHRDLKPGNVIISNGEPIVIDFGIAHAVDGAKLTQTGTFVGTPSYLSPEVIEGTDLGPATDVHAWGGTVAFASTGRPPYGAGSFEVIFFRILNGEIDMDGMHDALRPIVNRAVAREMGNRPSAAELVLETSRLNLDLPWTEDPGTPTGLTGNHTVQGQQQEPPASGGGGGSAAAAAGGAVAGGAAGAYLANQAGGSQGWGPPHTSSGANPTQSAWASPSAPQTSHAASAGWGSGAQQSHRPTTGRGAEQPTGELHQAASGGLDPDDESTDDLNQAASGGWDPDDESTDDLRGAQGTERIAPQDPRADPQGTMRIDPSQAAEQSGPQGTMRVDPGQVPGAEDQQGTMMMPADRSEQGPPPAPPQEPSNDAPQTQFFNSTLRPEDFRDILTPVGNGRSHQTQEFGEEDYQEGNSGLLGRFRRGSNDRLGDYFRGGADEDGSEEYYDDEYEEYEARRMHPLVLVPVMFMLAGVSLWFPWFGLLLGVLILAGLSALDVVKAEHARRLQRRGPSNSDTMMVVLSFPWALGRMIVRTAGFGVIYLLGGVLVGMVYSAFVETGGEGANYTGGFAIFVMVLLGYIMPSGREARHQAVWLVERVRFQNIYLYIGVIVGICLLTMLILSVGLGSAPDWVPFGGPSDWFS
ncbi:serine/threonine protein kinase [Nocardiopsis kunsanensis]|uniref:serine/threonine protein kinase n=1 Tax=Nocardiopsis kunsanensis TaxID=141693 RepID=UPI00034947B1|nr:protein kinase [Nocardiopsis kunsanensis]